MGYSPCGRKESDTTEQQHSTSGVAISLTMVAPSLKAAQRTGPINVLLPTTDWSRGGHMIQSESIITLRFFLLGANESVVKNLSANSGDPGSIPELGRSPGGGGNGNPLWYSCLGNPMHREAWWATVHGVTKSQT